MGVWNGQPSSRRVVVHSAEVLRGDRQLAANFSKTLIDRLGDRVRTGRTSETDLILLDEYRRSFGEAYEVVVRTIRDQLKLKPTGRPAKSTSSIIEKLRRESIRLSQVQDIAGCRVIVADVVEQDRGVASLREIFPRANVMDRRAKPNHGYPSGSRHRANLR